MKIEIAHRIVGRYLAATCHATMEHPDDKSVETYLRDHPGADPKKHDVREPALKTPKKSPWNPGGKKLKWQNDGGKMWARFTTNDSRAYTHKYKITQWGTGEWIVQLETPDGLKPVDAARSPAMAKQLAQQHLEKLVASDHP